MADGDRKMTDYETYMFMSSRGQAVDDLQPVTRAKSKDLDEQAVEESMVLEYVRLNGYITNALCRELLGIDDKDSANYILTNMFKKGLLKRTGRGKGTRYLL